MTDWVRLWHDMPTDPKWRVIARKSAQPLPCVIAVFTVMLTNASSNPTERGTLLAWDHEDVAAALDMDTEHVEAIYAAMQGKVLEGDRLSGWDRRQPKREDDSAKRVAKHRAEKKRAVTQGNAPETDTEKEKENTPLTPLARGDAGFVIDHWNQMAGKAGLPKVETFAVDRERKLKARLAEHGRARVFAAIDAVGASPHCRGENDRGWRANFDFILQPKSFAKLIEGAFGGATPNGSDAKPADPAEFADFCRRTADRCRAMGREQEALGWEAKARGEEPRRHATGPPRTIGRIACTIAPQSTEIAA